MTSFAIVDLETTGFGRADRVLEIAIVHVDDGRITKEWETLLNPMRDISNSYIHGITSDLVSLAPVFEEVADEIAYLLNDRIIVAHNIAFDSRMLIQEFARMNRSVNLGEGYCTLQATRMKLEAACKAFGIENAFSHRALGDARATAEILLKLEIDYLETRPAFTGMDVSVNPARTFSRDVMNNLSDFSPNPPERSLPNFNETGYFGARLSYMDALSYVMNDFVITQEEAEYLRKWAEFIGLSKEEQNEVHQDYLYLVLEAAGRDGRITEGEAALIKKAAMALGVHEPVISVDRQKFDSSQLSPGMRICFTGEARDETGNAIGREILEGIARSEGLIPVSSVTKKSCDILVAVDKSSMSGKTQKARGFNIPVISVEEFLAWKSR